MSSEPMILLNQNLSLAWAKAFLKLMEKGTTELSPFLVVITDFDQGEPKESDQIRHRLNQELKLNGLASCETVSNTIFPESLWDHSKTDTCGFFSRYEKIWPRIKKLSQWNRRGGYFRRLTAFSPRNSSERVNQLEHIIDTYRRGNHRRSALQASIFDPTRDHSNSRQQGFPCLQQIAFVPMGREGMGVTAFYPMQFLFERAYGNYLGLARLGRFMAAHMDLKMVQLHCFASVEKLGNLPKRSLECLADDLRKLLGSTN